MNFKRDILNEFQLWSEKPDRKPLVLRGARQVGKTTAVQIFGKQFKYFIQLNLEKINDRNYFTLYDRIEDTVAAILFAHNIPTNAKPILIFIDEIQTEPKAVAWLRYFYEQYPNLYVIAAGSLLETLLEAKNTFPVGRVEYLVMRPVSFSEFLGAIGEHQALEALNEIPLPNFAHPKLLNLFHTYALIGGMPEIVQRFAEHRDITRLKPIYNTLLTAYQDDVQKYASGKVRTQILHHCIQQIFLEAGKRIKFQGFGQSYYSSKDIGEALRILQKAMLCNLVYPSTQTELPPLPNLKKQPYLQVLDTGLVNYFCGLQEGLIGTKDLSDAYRGRVIQHWVGQQILSTLHYPLDQLHFWVREKNQSDAEVDYILPFKGMLIPLEVKSGSTGTLRSLQAFMDVAQHDMALRLYAGELKLHPISTAQGKNYRLLNLPYFLGEKLEAYLRWMVDQP